MSKHLMPLLLALVAIFAPAKGMLIAAGALIAIDLATGILAAIKRGEHITSAGFKRTIVKVCVYEIAICLAFMAETYLILDILPITKILTSYIGVTELKSIYENIDEIGGGNLLKTVVSKLSGPIDTQ